jgi:hypothetical protein
LHNLGDIEPGVAREALGDLIAALGVERGAAQQGGRVLVDANARTSSRKGASSAGLSGKRSWYHAVAA